MRSQIPVGIEAVRSVITLGFVLVATSCGLKWGIGDSLPPEEPTSIAEAISMLEQGTAEERVIAANTLQFLAGDNAQAIPPLLVNLQYPDNADVRRSAAIALGLLGPDAEKASAALVNVMEGDVSIKVRSVAAEALGLIGHTSAVPFLARHLYNGNRGYEISCARSIGMITGQEFADLDASAYRLDPEGVPLIVIDARNWWYEEGQFRQWADLPD